MEDRQIHAFIEVVVPVGRRDIDPQGVVLAREAQRGRYQIAVRGIIELERAIIKQRKVLSTINWLRAKAHRPPLKVALD